ncbi:hypothetical protein [Nostoc sp. MG11]|nr:hypothetical protein [Nostoc sp. MG11]
MGNSEAIAFLINESSILLPVCRAEGFRQNKLELVNTELGSSDF